MLLAYNMLTTVISHYLSLINLIQIKLQKKQKITIFAILVVNILLFLLIGRWSIFTMMASLCLYFVINKLKPLQNVCLALLSYCLAAISSTFVSFIFGLAGIANNDISKSYLTLSVANIIHYAVLYVGSLWVGRLIGRVLAVTQLPGKIWYIILFNSIIVFLLMASNVVIGDYMGYSKGVIYYNSILFVLIALACGISMVLLIKAQMREMQNRIKADSFKNLQDYAQKVEKMYAELRLFKHDYLNIMLSMKGYLESGETEKLYQYFTENIEPLNHKIRHSNVQLNQLMNIESIEVKSLLSSKLIYAMETGIDVRIEVLEPIAFEGIDKIDLVTVLGIFLDNAIEAAAETVREGPAETVMEGFAETVMEGFAETEGEGSAETEGEDPAGTEGEDSAETAREGSTEAVREGFAETVMESSAETMTEASAPQLAVTVIRHEGSVAIIIRNSYRVHEDLPYHHLGRREISSKGENRGIGLYKVKQILAGYPGLILDTSYDGQYFEQHLEIVE